MKKKLTALLLVSPLILTGCVIAVDGAADHYSKDSWEVRQDSNRATISSLELGQSIELIKGKLGTPDFYEVYNDNTEHTQVLFYRTHRTESDSKTTKDECHFLKFKNNKLVAIGDGAAISNHL